MNEVGSVGKIALGSLVAGAATKATEAVVELGKSAIEVGVSFETAMSQVAATMGITTDEIAAGNADFEMLSAKAKEMGASTKFTATEAAEGLNILAMAGLSAADACAGIDTVLSLAAAGAMSLDQAATYVTGSVKAFSDSMDNADYYADLMAKGATLANTSVSGLGEAMVGVGATAATYGQEADGLTLSLLRLAEQNITGSEAATAMNRAMMDLYTPTSKASAELERLGVAVYDSKGNAREFNTVVDELNGALSGMSQEQANASKNIIFSTFGLQAFNKMTVASTDTVEKFKEGLAEASGSAMQQMATQTDNLQGKLDIFKSACEGVGLSLYEVFEDGMKNSVGSATNAMDRLNKAITKGDLGKSLAHLSESLEDFLDTAIDLGEDALPVIIDAATWAIDNFPEIIAMLGTFKVGIAALDYAPAIMGMVEAWQAYKTANEGATVAQWLLNAAMDANPIGIMVVALAALTAGVVTYAATIETEGDKARKEMEDLAQGTSKVVDGMRDALESAQETVKEQDATSEIVKSLTAELKTLNAQEQLDEKQKARLKSIVQTLNGQIDGLNLTIDEQTGKLSENSAGWEQNIEAQMQQAKVNKVMEEMTELYDQITEGEIELSKIKEEGLEIDERRTEINERLVEIQQKGADASQSELEEMQALYDEADILTEKEASLAERKQEVTDASAELESQIDSLNVYIEDEKAKTEELTSAQESAAESTDAVAEATSGLSEEMAEWRDNLAEAITKSIDLFDKFETKTNTSKDQILTNMQSQVDGVQKWADDLETLAERGIDQGLLQHLADMGPSGAGYVATFTEMTGEELAKAGELFTEAMKVPDETASAIVESYTKAGEGATQAYIDGQWTKINDGTVKKAAEQIITDAKTAVEEGMGGTGSSSDFGKYGQQIPEDTAAGVEDNKDTLTDTVETMTTEIHDQFETSLAPSKFEEIGKGIVQGIINGINSRSKDIEDAVNAATPSVPSSGSSGGSSGGAGSKSSSISSYSSSMAYNSSASLYNSSAFADSVMATFGSMQASASSAMMASEPIEVNTSVYLEGDADGVFRLVRQETDKTVRSTGNNPLMKGEYKG